MKISREVLVFILKFYLSFTRENQKEFLRICPAEFVIFICECVVNALAGKLELKKSEVSRYKVQLRRLSLKTPSVSERRLILRSEKGNRLIRVLAAKVIDRFSPKNNVS